MAEYKKATTLKCLLFQYEPGPSKLISRVLFSAVPRGEATFLAFLRETVEQQPSIYDACCQAPPAT
jgi:hypothetical protein